MDKQHRRRKRSTKAPVSEQPETVDEPPRTGELVRSESPSEVPPIDRRPSMWDIRVGQLTSAHHALEVWLASVKDWGATNRETSLRYAAHGAVLATIVAALGLSQAHLTDLRLPALARRVSDSAFVSIADAAPTNPEAEMYARRAVVPRTLSAAKVASPSAATQVQVLATSSDILEAKEMARRDAASSAAKVAAPAPSLESLITTYTIQPGDTLLGIATDHNLSLEALVVANPSLEGQINHLILPGDDLRIPPSGGIVHIVKDGDTLDSIASKYETDAATIVGYAPNHVKTDDDLRPEQLLFVPGADIALPAPTPAPRQNTLVSVLQPKAAQQPSARNAPPASAPQQPARSSAPVAGSGNFRYPTPGGYLITTYFSGWHPGVDFAIAMGTPVYAADGGRVVFSGWDNTGYGYCIIIDHGNGFRTRYAHLSWIFPSYGQYVHKGEQIGKVGSTGHSSGPHLHFEIILNGVPRNPFAYLG
ncbi:MAG: peptidoglycan DD-metalloendopeptidase family protein [Anaerolineae bacterium]